MQNPQYLIFNEDRSLLDGPRTILCTGLGRSGTTAVASLLEYLGIGVGATPTSRNRENKELIRALQQGSDAARILIESYNSRYEVWGFKAPSLRRNVRETVGLFRNPLLIVPHRDPIGRLSRQVVSANRGSSLDDIYRAVSGQRRLIDELRSMTLPQLHISFQLLITAPDEALRAVADFIGVTVPEGDLRAHVHEARTRYLAPRKRNKDKVNDLKPAKSADPVTHSQEAQTKSGRMARKKVLPRIAPKLAKK